MTLSLAERVYNTCHLNGTFTLRSGQVSEEYFDKYLFAGQPALLREVAEAMVALLPDCDVLAGMEMGGIPIATVMSQLTGLPTVFVRKAAKPYGTRKVAEGGPVAGLRVVGIEDVVTTAGALVNGCLGLRNEYAVTDTVRCTIWPSRPLPSAPWMCRNDGFIVGGCRGHACDTAAERMNPSFRHARG
jgi:orotate phosphoribosyltransferase